MCGRFAQTQSGEDVAKAFQLAAIPDITPRYNIAPTQSVSVVTQSRQSDERVHHSKTWGLIPKWSKDRSIGQRLINARSETVAEKPSFREAFQKRRCLIVSDGFYEWQRSPEANTKQPYLIQLKTHTLFAFAGLWERWQPRDSQETVFTCTILTTSANEAMAPIHHRMPVILSPESYDEWLDPQSYNPGRLESLLHPCDSAEIATTPITREVNNPRNDSEAVQVPAHEKAAQ